MFNVKLSRLIWVTPFVGVWIETVVPDPQHCALSSHPSWVCGLKLIYPKVVNSAIGVTPFVGVWIETNIIIP